MVSMVMREKLEKLFEEENVHFEIMAHAEVYTAQETAADLHVPGSQVAKVVMVKANGGLVMLVLPAEYNIDFGKLKTVLGVKKVALASEEDFGDLFPDCDTGAMPPFGNLYGVPVWIDDHLADQESITFNACTHHEAARIAYRDYERLVKPEVAAFGKHVSS
jgi:Ala-tRNA(Pro) deacylase